MGMFDNQMDIIKVLRADENLLRLLTYKPFDGTNKDPLDPTLSNINDSDNAWDIRNNSIIMVPKANDLTNDNPACRICVYAGERRGNSNYLTADQELVVDIFVHEMFEKGDLRTTRISDRLNHLLVNERITGISKMDYKYGNPIAAPDNYVSYRHIFKYGVVKK